MRHLSVWCLAVSLVLSLGAGQWKFEGEDCRYLPAPDGQKAGPYTQQPGQSGTGVLAYFQEGRIAAYGKTPPAKWVRFFFATASGGVPCKLDIYDGDKKLGACELPDLGDYFTYDEFDLRLDLPACEDLRLVAPERPINIDYFILSDDEKPLPSRHPPAPDIDELKAKFVSGEIGACEEIVFATRTLTPEHWYANFGYYCYARDRRILNTQGRLAVYNVKTGAFRTLLEDLGGAVRDPCVHYDGKTIVFSYRPAQEERYHLYTIQSDGTGLTQLTSGEYDDIEPSWMPDGNIVFVSSRCRRWVNCWLTQVATIYRMNRDGSDIRPLSANIEHDNTPWMLPDGRILYMRWEYVDRRQVTFHHLWTMNPDGTQHQIYQGNTYPSSCYLDAKPVPGTADEVVLIDSPDHGHAEHGGYLSTLVVKDGPDARTNVKHVGTRWCFDPWAFSPDLFMATTGKEVFLTNRRGAARTLFALPAEMAEGKAQVFEPRPLVPHARERLQADRTDHSAKTGEFYLENVLVSRSLPDVAPGTITHLAVMESLPKPINYTGGMDPLSYGGTFTLTRQLGTVPVEADGSAYFTAPAVRPLFFVALDAQGRAVKRMQSFTQVMPGEKQGCVGCHEKKTENTMRRVAGVSQALARGPSKIDPSGVLFDVPEFPRDVQPILDRACVRCHNPDVRKGGVDLCGDRGVMFSISYYNLIAHNQVLDGRNSDRSDWPPYARGSGGSPLMDKILGNHHGATVTEDEKRRIMQWLDASAPYPGTYAALGCGAIGGYMQNNQVIHNDSKRPATVAAQEVIKRRCDACHAGKTRVPHSLSDENGISFWTPDFARDTRLQHYHRYLVFNVSRPEKSLYLLAPLAKAAGGLGICKDGKGQPVFASKDDPDYQKLLAMIEDGRQVLADDPRFDMPGFRPPIPYLREMKRYGVLPESFDLEHAPVDPYALDRQYWALDWTQLK